MSAPRRPRQGLWASLSPWRYFRHSWPAVLAITALVTIAHHKQVLDPLDTYAFFVVSHFLGEPPLRDKPPKVVVVSIDQASFETDYHERAPLRRSVLYGHLKAIYDLKPSLVVIDLDLSPVLPLPPPDRVATDEKGQKVETDEERESRHQGMIEQLFLDGWTREPRTKTVLMTPFPKMARAETESKRWQTRMKDHNRVEFGDARLPTNWGVTIKHRCAPDSLAAVAYLAALPDPSSRPRRSPCLDGGEESEKKAFIDPSHYLSDIAVVPIRLENARPFAERTQHALDSIRPSPDRHRAVVFFGGGWGEGDTHVTPVGELYGVEVQAGAYLSVGNPPRGMTELTNAVLDIIAACVVGAFFTFFWREYFSAAMATSPVERERAVLWLLGLGIITLGFTAAFVIVSRQLLGWGLWLSPVPLLVGMSIHAFFESLSEARHGASIDVSTADHAPPTRGLFRYLRRTVVEASPRGVVESVEETAWVAPDEARPQERGSPWWRRVAKYFREDVRDLSGRDESGARLAGILLFVKRLAWLVLVAAGFLLVVPWKWEAWMRLLTPVLLVAVLATSAHAAEPACRGLAAISNVKAADLGQQFERAKADSACTSFTTVLGKLLGRDTTAGRRLEKDKPFNPAAAQANVDKAMRDPEMRKRIEALQTQVPDAAVRLLHEAVIFDEEGFYDARELRIQQLRQRLN